MSKLDSALMEEESRHFGGRTSYSRKPMPPWWKNFFWNSYCEDWPQYGRPNDRDAEERLPTLKCSLLETPDLLQGDRIPALTVKEKFAALKFLATLAALTAQIASLMSLAKQFEGGVENDAIKKYGGKETFEIAIYILQYTPLIYALMIPFMYNTKRSRDAFYHCLSRGYLLDFPESLQPSFFASHRIALLYVLALVGYFCIAGIMFLMYEAPNTIWIIFINNMCFGIALMWSEHFCLENQLISLSQFVETVDDRAAAQNLSGLQRRPVIDNYTLQRAGDFLKKLKPLRTRCSYKEYTQKWVFEGAKTTWRTWLMRFLVVFAMVALGALMYFLASFNSEAEEQTKWVNQITPCTQVCFDHEGRDIDTCFNCMCDCATSFGAQFNTEQCRLWFNVPGCPNDIACAVYTNQTCGGSAG